jgi:hypothetical protein
MEPVTTFIAVLLAAAALFAFFGLRASPTSEYETADDYTVRTRTALFSCATICLAGAVWVFFFVR